MRNATQSGITRARQRITAEQQWLELGAALTFAVQMFRLWRASMARSERLGDVADGTAKRIVKPGQIFNRIHTEMSPADSIKSPAGTRYNVAAMSGPPQDVIAYAASSWPRAPPEIPFEEADQTPMARLLRR